jgi:thiaminase/transcriptional activator TenA
MSPTEQLRLLAHDDWHAATNHAFTDALANGSLSQEKMAGYLQQDYLFVGSFVRLLASAVASAPTLADAVPGAQFLGVICGPENTYFLRSMETLGIGQADHVAPETKAIQDLMDEARRSNRYEMMMAVLVVAEWVYLDWATPFENRAKNLPFWLGEWITLHSGEDFASVVSYLRGQLDTTWEVIDSSARDDVRQIFRQAVTLERSFFDAAWTGFTVTS